MAGGMSAYTLPAIHHLAWMLQAPRLLDHPLSFYPGDHAGEGVWQRLAEWDRVPAQAPESLLVAREARFGLYFEDLYQILLEDLLGWPVLIRNLPVREGNRTLGEMDFIVRNPLSGQLEHHEIAVKFYLGYEGGWYGPDARDRLDLKTHRLLSHQSQLTRQPAALDTLRQRGIDEPIQPRVFMPGYLFHPAGSTLPLPDTVPADYGRGEWLRYEAAGGMSEEPWVPLCKPHWLGLWQQSAAPDPEWTGSLLRQVAERRSARLFAKLAKDPATGNWTETLRRFVVSSQWPG